MRSTRRSSAIGGTADDPLTATEPPYFTRRTLDCLVDQLRVVRRSQLGTHGAHDAHDDTHVGTLGTHGGVMHRHAHHDVLSLGAYRGELRRAIHHMKYRNARWIAAYFGRALAAMVRETTEQHTATTDTSADAAWRPHIVTWAPTTARRLRLRGHDQSAIIASSYARATRIRCVRVLRRIDDNTQTGSTREVRKRGLQFVVRARVVRGRSILLIDDVMTTGTTLARARDALLAAGAHEVRCAVVAHVRARHPSRVG